MVREPILLLIYNRPELTRRVFEVLRNVRPRFLYVAADGPKENDSADQDRCQATRALIQTIDWECDVHTLLRTSNLGCRVGVSSAIDWFFQQVESGIILEDDILASTTFFSFCEELLERYRCDARIMMISGDNFQDGHLHGDGSYYFSGYSNIWGWATWRRAWQFYDVSIGSLPAFMEQSCMRNLSDCLNEHEFWLRWFLGVYQGKVDTWDFQWLYTVFCHHGLSIMPNVNLITNIGFGELATHTQNSNHPHANLPRSQIGKLRHPKFVMRAKAADDYTRQHVFGILPE